MNVSKQYNFKQIRREIMRALRGKRSQGAVSQRMGYAFNQAYRWESGSTQIKWQEFVRLCAVCRADLSGALAYSGDISRIDLFLRETIGHRPILQISHELGISRFALQDWLKRKSDPSLDHILRILHHTDTLLYFIETLLGHAIPSLATEIDLKRKQLKLFYDHPVCSAITMCFKLKQYAELTKHEPGFIAKMVGISPEEEDEYLKALQEVRVVALRRGKYQTLSDHYDSRGDFERQKNMRAFWMQKGIERMKARTKPGPRGEFGFGIFPVSAEKEERIQEALSAFISTTMEIVRESDDGATKIKVLSMQLFTPSE